MYVSGIDTKEFFERIEEREKFFERIEESTIYFLISLERLLKNLPKLLKVKHEASHGIRITNMFGRTALSSEKVFIVILFQNNIRRI